MLFAFLGFLSKGVVFPDCVFAQTSGRHHGRPEFGEWLDGSERIRAREQVYAETGDRACETINLLRCQR
jgi:hypothetical protein